MSPPSNPAAQVSRRAWLKTSAVGAAALAGGCNTFRPWGSRPAPASAVPATATREPVIDAHVHLWAADEARFPFHADAPYEPAHRAPIEPFLAHMDAAGIDGAILVHPEPYQDDHRYVEECLRHAPERLRATCLFDPNSPTTPDALIRLCENPRFVALRIHAFRPDRLPDFGSEELRLVWQTAGQLGLAIQLHGVPQHIPRFLPLIEQWPRTRVLIDHLGRPGQGTPEEMTAVYRLAALPNVFMKFSGLAHASKGPFPHDDLKPFLAGMVDLFGPERVLWGDSYRGEPYGESARAVDVVLDFLDPHSRAMIAGGTAARLFRFHPPVRTQQVAAHGAA